jgi:hypothetical protein
VFWGKEFSRPTNTAHTEKNKNTNNIKINIFPLHLCTPLLANHKEINQTYLS